MSQHWNDLIGCQLMAPDWSEPWRRRSKSILYSLCTLVQTQADHETSVQSVSVHVYTQIPPRCPRAMGEEETLLSVAGLGAYVGTKLGTTQPRNWEYFWHEHQRCSRGHSTIRNSAAVLTKYRLCGEIFKSVYSMGIMSKHD